MKISGPIILILAITGMGAGAQARLPMSDYPSCDLRAQHALKSTTGGAITDARQAHIGMRTNILQADIGTARKARRLSETQTETLWARAEAVRKTANGVVAKRGFLSAAQRKSYDRMLDSIAIRACRA